MCPTFEFDSSLFFCQRGEKKSARARRTPRGSLTILTRKQEDGCDLDRTYVRDKRFVWTSELHWTGRRKLIKKKGRRGNERTTSSFCTCNQ